MLNNGGDALTVAAGASSFTFDGTLVSGDKYSVAVQTQPTGPAETCVVSAGTGTVASANVTDIAIDCTVAVAGMVLIGGPQGAGQGISGETVTFYDATSPTTGMGTGSAAATLGTTATATDGRFTLAVSPSLCPSSGYDVVYVVASPGKTNSASPVRLASVVGTSCSALVRSASPSVGIVNELTTAGTAYAFNWFANYDGTIGVATNQAANGLQVAAATYGALVDVSTGTVTSNLHSTQSAATRTLNALANSFAACTTSGSSSSRACGLLFSAATLPVLTPTDTFDAALNVAGYPGLLGDIYSVATASPYAPALSANPNDWTLVETYTTGGLFNPVGLAIDGTGNIWVVNHASPNGANSDGSNGSLSIFGPTGTALNNFGITTSGTFYGPERIAIGLDNMGAEAGWITNMPFSYQGASAGIGRVLEFGLSRTLSSCPVSSTTCALASAQYVIGASAPAPGFAQPQGIAIDSLGNAWVASLFNSGPPGVPPGVLTELSSTLTPSTPFYDEQDSQSQGPIQYQDVGVDGQGNIWALDGANGLLQKFNPSSGTWLNNGGFATGFNMGLGVNPGFVPDVGNQIAIGPSGNVWVAQSSNTGGTLPGFNSSGQLSSLPTEPDLQAPNAIAIDGNGDVFVVNAGNNSGDGTCLVEIGVMQGGSTLQDLSYNANSQSTCGLGNASFYDTYGLAIDQAGNLWAVNYDGPAGTSPNGTLVEVVGAAAPTVTPVYQATKSGSPAAVHGQSKNRTRRKS